MLTEKIALFMTLFGGVPYSDIMAMPVGKLDAILNWRVKYEETKQQRVDEELSRQKATSMKKK